MRVVWQKTPGQPYRQLQGLLALLGLAALSLLFYSFGMFEESSQYVLVIDAGSSGTRMNAYEWRRPAPQHSAAESGVPSLVAIAPDAAPHKVPRRALETRRAYKRVETEPGLDKFTDQPDRLGSAALQPLLDWAQAVVPAGRWSSTPVFLFGTAGMRRLSADDRELVLNAARDVLRRSGLRFKTSWARIITGIDEGVYGWMALNAVAGTLGTEKTIGSLDLGGSSLEVTFALDATNHEADDDGSHVNVNEDNRDGNAQTKVQAHTGAVSPVNISLMGIEHTLYTHSHRHFGLDDAFERSVALLLAGRQRLQSSRVSEQDHRRRFLQAADASETLKNVEKATQKPPKQQQQPSKKHKQRDAGLSKNATTNQSTSQSAENTDLSISEARKSDRDSTANAIVKVQHPCLHAGYHQQYHRRALDGIQPEPAVVLLEGAPDNGACAELARAVVTAPTTCTSPPCALGAPQPRSAGHFAALSGFYVVAHFFNLAAAGGADSPPSSSRPLNDIIAAGKRFCQLSWQEVQARHDGELAAESYCFRAPYVASLVKEGLHLNEDQVKLGGPGAGWTLGAALLEGHRLAGLVGNRGTVATTAATGGGQSPAYGGSDSWRVFNPDASNALTRMGAVFAALLLLSCLLVVVWRRQAAAALSAAAKRRMPWRSNGWEMLPMHKGSGDRYEERQPESPGAGIAVGGGMVVGSMARSYTFSRRLSSLSEPATYAK